VVIAWVTTIYPAFSWPKPPNIAFREREDDRGPETDPLGSGHAVDALRYLMCKLDRHFMAKRRKPSKSADGPVELIPA
jgi:hypothetical protein